MKVKPLIETLNAFFTGSNGKGYDALYDTFGIEPQDFSHLSKKRKQELVREFIQIFKCCFANDLLGHGIINEETFDCIISTWKIDFPDCLLSDLYGFYEALDALIQLTEHYNVSLNKAVVEEKQQ